jgi:transposase
LLERRLSLLPLVGEQSSGKHQGQFECLETTPRRWKVIETVRERFSCRDCETISQAPAPFHVIPRGWAGPSLLAMIVFEKFGQHQPLNRQAERYALEGAPIALSTMADAVGAVSTALDPLRRLVEAHVMAAERLHGDDSVLRRHAERMIVMV